MKKILLGLLSMLLISGCSNSSNKYQNVPSKDNPSSTVAYESSVTTRNIDNYLFRDDSIYVDLRPYSWIAKDGHIAGFAFYPFYDFIASNTSTDTLYSFKKITKPDGSIILLGDEGSFSANYVESEMLLNRYFPKDKNIFAISQSGLESIYFLNLLKQLGYDASKLYNIGGFMISPGFEVPAYNTYPDAKYKVAGNPDLEYSNNSFTTFSELTKLEK